MSPWFTLVACVSEPAAPEAPCGDGVACVVAGRVGRAGSTADDQPATRTMLYQPQDVTLDGAGGFYIADFNNHQVRHFDADGSSHVVAGDGFPSGGDEGPATQVSLKFPSGVVVDPEDPEVFWIAVSGVHQIARVEAGFLELPYGFPTAGYAGDGGPVVLAQFDRPTSIVFGDEPGEMYVSDRMNQVVRRIGEGTIASVVGTPQVAGYAGDGGPAVEALLNAPADTMWDPASRLDRVGDRLVIADTGNGVVREVDLATGTIFTLSDAFVAPHDVEIAPDGTVYVADIADGCVRAVDPDGGVTDVVGTCGELGTFVDGVDARDARFEVLAGIDLSPDGDLYLADAWNHVIVRVRGI